MSSNRLTPTITVGLAHSDITGNDNRALQAAVDYIAGLGGGTVEIGPGTYTMRDSLHLRNRVTVRGQGRESVLFKANAAESPLTLDGDYGEEQITVADAAGFAPGVGVSVTDDNSGGFHTVVCTLIWADGDRFGAGKPMLGDYLVSRNARAATTFPVISGYGVTGVGIENLTIQGNKENNPYLNGCRGAGIFLYRSHGTRITACTIQDYNGDGISFQQSNDVSVEDCVCSGNTHLGLHPGSGSGSPAIRNCRSSGNGRIGLFLCWRVKNGIFENNRLNENGETGISIGHKDTDNTFLCNEANGNGREGVLFRDESEPMAGHRNYFERNEILDNGAGTEGCGIRILGETRDLTFVNNRIGNSPDGRQKIGIMIGERSDRIQLNENELSGNVEREIEDRREGNQPDRD
ncbi:MAG: right-handed parallel beta-helix repeat-containing protein [Gemmatimonadota bacterium]|nr:right-handed parallel beta-helix repeat-containing protein [Gemmatimonadota bacterium]